MAFPVVEARSTGSQGSNATSHTITMPAGINIGDLLVIVFSSDGNPTCSISSGNWLKLGQRSQGTVATGAIFYKVAEGSDTATVTTSASEQSTHVVLRISGAASVNGSFSDASSTNSNPPLHLPGKNPETTTDWLWVVTRSGDGATTASAAPTNYSNLQTIAGGTGGASTNTAERSLTAFSEDPGTFTSAAEQWVSWTLAIGPVDEPSFIVFDAGTSATTQSFTPPNNSLLVAYVAGTDGGLGDVTDSLGGSWTRLARAEATSQAVSGQAEIWARDIATGQSMTVTCTNASSFSSMRVRAYTGLEVVANQTATPVTAENSSSLETTVNAQTIGSLVVTSASYFTAAIDGTENGSTFGINEYDASNSATGLAGEALAYTTSTGNVTLGWTNAGLSATVGRVAIELLPAPSSVDGWVNPYLGPGFGPGKIAKPWFGTSSETAGAPTNADAGDASLVVTGNNATVTIAPSIQSSSVTVTANNPQISISSSVQDAAVAVTSNGVSPNVKVSADASAVTVTADNTTSKVSTQSEISSVTISGYNPNISIKVQPPEAVVSVTANNPSVVTGTIVNPEVAVVTVSANDSSTKVSTSSGVATIAVASENPSPIVGPTGTSSVAAVALNPASKIAPLAGSPTVLVSALDATVQTDEGTNAPAGVAALTVAANNSTIQINVPAGVATVVVTAGNPSVNTQLPSADVIIIKRENTIIVRT